MIRTLVQLHSVCNDDEWAAYRELSDISGTAHCAVNIEDYMYAKPTHAPSGFGEFQAYNFVGLMGVHSVQSCVSAMITMSQDKLVMDVRCCVPPDVLQLFRMLLSTRFSNITMCAKKCCEKSYVMGSLGLPYEDMHSIWPNKLMISNFDLQQPLVIQESVRVLDREDWINENDYNGVENISFRKRRQRKFSRFFNTKKK